MKSLAFAVTLLASFGVSAQTYIDYEDGSTYTLERREEAYVTHEIVFVKREYSSGDVYFRALAPNTKRDYIETPWDGLQPGSHEWCKQYVGVRATRLICRRGNDHVTPMVMVNMMKTMTTGRVNEA